MHANLYVRHPHVFGILRRLCLAALLAICGLQNTATAGVEVAGLRVFQIPIERTFIHLPTNEEAQVHFTIVPFKEDDGWEVQIDGDWIHSFTNAETQQEVSSGSGRTAVQFNVDSNDTQSVRSTTIRIVGMGAAANYGYEYSIVQSARARQRLAYGAGNNIYGESYLDGTTNALHQPYPLEGYTGYADARSGWGFTFLLKSNGALSVLHDGSQQSPQQVAVDVAAMDYVDDEVLYIDSTGDLYAAEIQTYQDFPGEHASYVESDVAKVIAGQDGYLYITDSNELYGVGKRNYGRLGTGRTESSDPVFMAADIVDAALSAYNGAYLTSDGELYAMGKPYDSWFGLNDFSDHFTPELIASNVRSIESTRHGLIIIKDDNSMSVLGQDVAFGVDDDGIPLKYAAVTPIASDVESVSLTQSNTSYESRVFFRTTAGATYAMGTSFDGELGWGGFTPAEPPWDVSPKLVGDGIKSANGGLDYTIFVNDDGTLSFAGLIPYHWSETNPFREYFSLSVRRIPIDRIVEIDAHQEGVWLLTEQGDLIAGGRNNIDHPAGAAVNTSPVVYETGIRAMDGEEGLLLLSGETLTFYPRKSNYHPISGPTDGEPYTRNVSNALDIASTSSTLYWVDSIGDLWGIGDAFLGMLGDVDEDGDYRDTPVLIDRNVAKVDAGDSHVAYIKSNGTAWTLGSDYFGQLGDGDLTPFSDPELGGHSPFPYKVGDGILDIWAAGASTAFLKSDGTLWAMGFIARFSDTYFGFGTPTPRLIAEGVVDADVSVEGYLAYATRDGRFHRLNETGELTYFTNAYGDRKAVGVEVSGTNMYIFTSEVPSLDKEELVVDVGGATEQVGVFFNAPWSAFSYASWITLNKESSNGSDTSIELTIAPNTEGCPRRGWVSVGGGVIEINQLGDNSSGDCYYYSFPTSPPNPSYGTVPDIIEIEWTDAFADDFETLYELYRSTNTSFVGAERIAEDLTSTQFRDTSAAPGQVYNYWVRASRNGSYVNYEGPSEGLRGVAPPEDVKASQGRFSDRVEVAWSRSSGAESYDVFRADVRYPEFADRIATGVTDIRYNDFEADPDRLYVYSVAAFIDGKVSLRSPTATGYRVEDGITTLRASDGLFSDHIAVSWEAFPDAASYTLYRNTENNYEGAEVLAAGLAATTYDDSIDSSNAGQTYYYWVRPTVAGDLKNVSNTDPGHIPVQRATSLVAWGENTFNQTNPPEGDLTDLVEIAAGINHSLALKSDGTVVGWGRNEYGQATPPDGLADVVDIATGYDHSLALKSDGTVVAWGRDSFGKATVPELGYVIDIAAGADHSLALLANGTVVAWGGNDYGQIDIPNTLQQVVEIAAGGYHNIARRADGTIAVWGDNTYGQRQIPETITTALAVASGWYHLLAILPDYTVIAWGNNEEGQLNVPSSVASGTISPLSQSLAESTDIVGIAGGLYHSLGVTEGGDLVSWGNNQSSATDSPATLSTVSKISAGDSFNMALGESATPRIENILTGNLNQAPGGTQIMKVRATGGADLTYQWYRNNIAIAGAKTDTLALTDLTVANSGSYTVEARSGGLTALSAPVALSVSSSNAIVATLVGASLKGLLGAQDTWLLYGIETNPSGLNITYRHNGSTALPTLPGSYSVQAKIEHAGYTDTVLDAIPFTVENVERTTTIERSELETIVRFHAPIGFSYELRASTNLKDWETLLPTAIGTGNIVEHTLTTTSKRFFRVVYKPAPSSPTP